MEPKAIGILGGTFDPIHIGHLTLALYAKWAFKLDVVLMEVAPNPWEKVGTRPITDPEIRYRAVEVTVKDFPSIEPSRLEIDRGGLTYTIDTLHDVKALYPEATPFLILGADAAAGLLGWHRAPEVAAMAEVIVANRPGCPFPQLPNPPWRIHPLLIPPLDVSGTDLRPRIAAREPVDLLVNPRAQEILRTSPLYSGVSDSREL